MSNADINIKYINPIYFINNYDDEIININKEKDFHEFFIELMDKLENRLININKDNIINYYFKGAYNIN